MKKKDTLQIICISLLLFTVGHLYADSLYFCRSGRIIAVKMTTKRPKIDKVCPYNAPSTITENVAYAMLTLTLDKGRTIGTNDYSLIDKAGNKYPCIAIQAGKGPFDATWIIEKTDPKKKYTLLFKVSEQKGKQLFFLHYNLPVGKAYDILIDFKDSNNPVKKITDPKK